jgi:hypothetical protein
MTHETLLQASRRGAELLLRSMATKQHEQLRNRVHILEVKQHCG